MYEIKITVTGRVMCPSVITIGQRTESGAVKVAFTLADWDMGGETSLIISRPDGKCYAASGVSCAGNVVTWLPDGVDTDAAGMASMDVRRVYANGDRKLSAVGRVRIVENAGTPESVPPDVAPENVSALYYWYPVVDASGNLKWIKSNSTTAPGTVNIMGSGGGGAQGSVGLVVQNGQIMQEYTTAGSTARLALITEETGHEVLQGVNRFGAALKNRLAAMASSQSPLKGKKLVAAGDSITAGYGVSSPSYVYSALAAEKCGMEYQNIAMSGKTMADVRGRNGFAVERYALVPEDTDILTLWFGFNDKGYGPDSMRDDYCEATYGAVYASCTDAQKAAADAHANWETTFLGTTDATDTKTWCGAWRTVLAYFTDTRYIPHIGVLLPYGITSGMMSALKTLCAEFNVPTLDVTDVNQTPSIGWSGGSYHNNMVHRNKYTKDGVHPNAEGYKRLETAYTRWLERM